MVTVTKIVEPAEFKPVKIELTLETEEEVAALRTMSVYNIRIPRLVATGRDNVPATAEQIPIFHAVERILDAISGVIGK